AGRQEHPRRGVSRRRLRLRHYQHQPDRLLRPAAHDLGQRHLPLLMHSVLITGAASGIGLGLTRHFAALGHRVIACDLRQPEIGGPIRKLAFDVADNAQIEGALASVADDPPDVLINNAGLQYVAPLENYPPEKWQQLIAVMLTGAALLTRAA